MDGTVVLSFRYSVSLFGIVTLSLFLQVHRKMLRRLENSSSRCSWIWIQTLTRSSTLISHVLQVKLPVVMYKPKKELVEKKSPIIPLSCLTVKEFSNMSDGVSEKHTTLSPSSYIIIIYWPFMCSSYHWYFVKSTGLSFQILRIFGLCLRLSKTPSYSWT